jgi:hypothetical protein
VEPLLGRRVDELMQNTLFALEVCARYEPAGRLHQSLLGLLRSHPPGATLQGKWQFYRAVVGELLNGFPLFEMGCWDYFDEDTKAKASFDQWCRGMTTEEGARKEPSGSDPYRGDPRYLTFTMAFLIVKGSPCDQAMARLCQVPDAALWQKDTFRRILEGLGVLNFASIVGDVAYLIPRDDGWGLTRADLTDPKFHYLRALT